MDGVVVSPPLGWNVAISRKVNRPLLEVSGEVHATSDGRGPGGAAPASMLRSWLEWGRYSLRRPMPGVAKGLAELARVRAIHVVSARSHAGRHLTERWLETRGLRAHIADIHLKPAGVPSFHFKYQTLRALGIREHVDDDGSTADYLARHGGIRVYLCDWPRNRGLDYAPGVQVVPSLTALARLLAEERGTPPGEGSGPAPSPSP